MHDNLGAATLSEGLVEAAEGILGAFLDAATSRSQRRGTRRASLERLAGELAPAGPCPACQVQAEHESYVATVLVRTLEDPGWRQRFIESDGLCLAHFRGAVLAEETPERLRWLIEDQRRRLHELRSELEEYGRKHDYRFTEERYGREADVAVRATEALAAGWFDLPQWPRSGVKLEGGAAQIEEDNHG